MGDVGEGEEEEEEEAWGGISMDVEDGDVMDEDDDDAMNAPEEAIVRTVVPGEEEDLGEDDEEEAEMDGDDMLDDLADIAGSSDDDDDEDEASRSNGSSKLALTSLPLQLLQLTRLTPLSFVPSSSFISTVDTSDSNANTLISTSATTSAPTFPESLSTLSEAVTTIHVRAIEALNNLFVALAQSKKTSGRMRGKELQMVFERVLEGMHAALTAHEAVPKVEKKPDEEVDEVEERRSELVSAGAGVVWGCSRLGLGEDASLVRSATSFRLRVTPTDLVVSFVGSRLLDLRRHPSSFNKSSDLTLLLRQLRKERRFE